MFLRRKSHEVLIPDSLSVIVVSGFSIFSLSNLFLIFYVVVCFFFTHCTEHTNGPFDLVNHVGEHEFS